MNKKLFLLDAYALIFRAFYAMMRNARVTSTGLNTSAIFGFVNALQDVLKKERPTHIAVCFDPKGGTFRHEAYPAYKAQRDATPEDIIRAVPFIKRIIAAYRIPIYEVPGFEADDVIGTLARKAQDAGFDTFMMTPDKDFGQLVDHHIKMYRPARSGGEPEVMGVDEIKAKYGIDSPQQVIDILGLMGDTADNIPGCPGVGEKTAEKLVQQFGDIDNLLQHTHEIKGALRQKVEANAEQIKFSRFLATIKTDVPVDLDEDELKRVPVDKDALRQVFAELEFRALTARLIDGNEANVGLDGQEVAPAPQPAATAVQASLFDTPAEPAAPPVDRLDTVTHDYRLVDDAAQAAQIVAQMLAHGTDIAVRLEARGDEAMRAVATGIALCNRRHTAFFMPLDAAGAMLAAVAPLFGAQCRIVSDDVKRLMVLLHAHGIPFTAPYYDTGVAHYLLEPEHKHDTAALAPSLLHYEPLATGNAGARNTQLTLLDDEQATDNACELADLTLALPPILDNMNRDNGTTQLLNDVEMPLVSVLASMEIAGVRIDVQALADYSVKLTTHMEALEQECHQLAGMAFNTASPAQVGEVIFGHLLPDVKAKRTKTGQYVTTEDELLKYRSRHPIIDKILELRGVKKLLSTYVNALPALINPRTGRIHTTYKQTVTATGRLSSVNPNLQNIPVRSDDGKEIRRAFIPSDGNVFFSADYSQIELRLVADIAGDQTMLDAFAHGQDIHAITAARINHVPVGEITSDERRKAKTANFGILYGISAFGLAERLGVPRSEAKALIENYFKTFPQIKDYIDRSIAAAHEKGYVETLFGRKRHLPDINSRNANIRAFNERNAINAPIQGTAADIIKVAMNRIHRRFVEEKLQSRMILQVHDELNFDVVPAELQRVQEIVVEEMQNAYHGRVSLIASHAAAANWLDAH